MSIKIEKNIPLPQNAFVKGKWRKIAKNMDFGDSVLFDNSLKAQSLRTNINRLPNAKAIGRTTDEGHRVWKIELPSRD